MSKGEGSNPPHLQHHMHEYTNSSIHAVTNIQLAWQFLKLVTALYGSTLHTSCFTS